MIVYDDDKSRIDVDRVHGWLASSYWSPDVSRDVVARAIEGSHCLGVYQDGVQIGFARMITDHATFGWLADVWVDEAARGQGIGRAMVRWFLARPDYAAMRRVMLGTRDAHGVYASLGFMPLAGPQRMMERLSPEWRAQIEGWS